VVQPAGWGGRRLGQKAAAAGGGGGVGGARTLPEPASNWVQAREGELTTS
jgi:hypothetical protein